jgi:hypothetical protein
LNHSGSKVIDAVTKGNIRRIERDKSCNKETCYRKNIKTENCKKISAKKKNDIGNLEMKM